MAQRFKLILDLDDASLAALSARGARLAVAKPAGVLPPNVVWLACDPAPRITIAWDEVYGVFGAEVPLHDAAPIRILGSCYPAAERAMHPFLGDRFSAPVASEPIPAGHYDVANQTPFTAAFGLLQAATVNGNRERSPVNVSTLAPGSQADFVAVTTLYVWASPLVETGSTAAHLPARAALIALTPGDPIRRYRYESADASFTRITDDHSPELPGN